MLSYLSPIWSILVFGAALLIINIPAFRAADTPPGTTTKRDVTIDGLRGFLSLLVFVQHSGLYHNLIQGVGWHPGASNFIATSGQVGVALFFMITGYLFWGKMVKAKGRPSWVRYGINRVFRLLPLYLLAATIVIIGAMAKTGFHLNVSLFVLLKSITKWLSGGIADEVPINGYAWTWLIIAGVTWTLRYEWGFYAAILGLGRLCRWRIIGLILPPISALVGLIALAISGAHDGRAPWFDCLTLFSLGATTAAIRVLKPHFGVPDLISSSIVVSCLGYVLLGCKTANAVLPTAALWVAFLCISDGSSLLGLLRTRGATRLGDVSYGLYLLQGPVLAVIFGLHSVRRYALHSPIIHWLLCAIAVMILVSLATIAHKYVELPGQAAGRWLSRPKRTHLIADV